MKIRRMRMWILGAAAAAACAGVGRAAVLSTERELYGTGDFDGDGRTDAVIVDRASGKYRIGYAEADGSLTWAPYRASGITGVTGLGVGRLLSPKADALAFASADENRLAVVSAADRATPEEPIEIDFLSLGPNTPAAVRLDEDSPLQGLLAASIYNDPVPNRLSWFRSDNGEFELVDEADDPAGKLVTAVLWKPAGKPEVLAGAWQGKTAAKLQVLTMAGGAPKVLAALDQPAGATFALADRRDGSACLLVYTPGGKQIQSVRLTAGKQGWRFAPGPRFEAPFPLGAVVPALEGTQPQWAAMAAKGQAVALFRVSPDGGLKCLKELTPREGDKFFGLIGLDGKVLATSAEDYLKAATHGVLLTWRDGQWTAAPRARLSSLADTDDATIPEIYKRILATLKAEGIRSASDMKPYTNTIPGTAVRYVMVPVPGGEFVMGSPPNEPGRRDDEGPQHKVKLDPFWIGKFEVTWNEYEIFMYPDDEKKLRHQYPTEEYVNKTSDAVSRPSKPYTEMSFGMGRDRYPAICMTQHAANKYCQWLSAKTGHFYRLPTEAEWEYACRAGTTTAYSFGEDASKLGDYAWYEDNSDFKYHKVGRKKPNPWGLYDMHGNVWEWCLDQYEPNYSNVMKQAENPWLKPKTLYPRVVRGGSYDDPPEDLRSAARRPSDPSWKMRDPQLPKSIWWFSDAPWLGFRLVRPLKVPPPNKLREFWNTLPEERD